MNNHCFDTSRELLLQRYRQGVKLIKPIKFDEEEASRSILKLYTMPFNSYFFDSECRFVDCSSTAAALLGVQSVRDLLKRTPNQFTSRNLGSLIVDNNIAVMKSAAMKVIEEAGEIKNGLNAHALSFKYPWYHNDQVIGLFGCSIQIDVNSLSDLDMNLSCLMSTGLLSLPEISQKRALPKLKYGDVFFSKREEEVLTYLVRGKTAKEIGLLLYISKRTVERHLENIKLKANCKTKSELIDKFIDQL